jgi:hypothetical protein
MGRDLRASRLLCAVSALLLFAILVPAAVAQRGANESYTYVVISGVPKGQEDRVKGHKAMSSAQLQQLVARKDVRVLTPSSVTKSEQNIRALIQAAQAQVQQANAKRPHIINAIPKQDGPISSSFRNRRGQTVQVQLLGRNPIVFDLYGAAVRSQDKNLQLSTLTALYNNSVKQAQATKNDALLATINKYAPNQYANKSVPEIYQAIIGIVGVWDQLIGKRPPGGGTRPPGCPTNCNQELGAGYGGDMAGCIGSPGTGFNSNGLYTRCNWPLKYYNTCTRDQANRGTCAAFSICAAVESRVAVQYGTWINLSEQDLYKKMRYDWTLGLGDFYDDGFSPLYSFAGQLVNNYYFPYERDWDYNPSCSRQANDNTETYTNSCVNYNGGDCSDTNHQAKRECYTVQETIIEEVVTTEWVWVWDIFNFLWSQVPQQVTEFVEEIVTYEVCVYTTNTAGTSGFRVTPGIGFVPVLNTAIIQTDPNASVDAAKVLLDSQCPIVFGFIVPLSWGGATQNGGFVAYSASETTTVGAHGVLITGYVDNDELPSGIPSGSGGGYFIVKNSWGSGWGDMGYCYLPYNWVTRWGVSMEAVTSVSQ